MCTRTALRIRLFSGSTPEMEWNQFVSEYQHHVAGVIYLLAAIGFCLYWWRLTGGLRHRGWRDLFRGIAIVVIFTPWYVSDAHDFYAPAVLVVMMDLLLGNEANGLAASLALLMATAVMLAALIIRRFLRRPVSAADSTATKSSPAEA